MDLSQKNIQHHWQTLKFLKRLFSTRSFIITRCRKGPRIDPCGQPYKTLATVKNFPCTKPFAAKWKEKTLKIDVTALQLNHITRAFQWTSIFGDEGSRSGYCTNMWGTLYRPQEVESIMCIHTKHCYCVREQGFRGP